MMQDPNDLILVTYQSLLETLLVQKVANESNTSSQDKKSVQTTVLNLLISFLMTESATASKHVDKTHSYTAINIENQVRLLLRSHLFDSQGKA